MWVKEESKLGNAKNNNILKLILACVVLKVEATPHGRLELCKFENNYRVIVLSDNK